MTLVDRSDDLRRLIEEEYDLEIRDGNLLVHHVPFVNSASEVEYCTLVSDLSTNGERTIQPGRHEVWVVGSVPHDHRGNEVSFIADRDRLDYGGGVVACCRLSLKPGGRMPVDYYEKFSNYVRVLSGYARGIDAGATHKNYPVRQTSPDESVFRYHDAATSRSGLSAVTGKLRLDRVAIIGLGGTGSYILDQVAKTPVGEIHLYDDDILYAHNSFRAPGAAALAELIEEPSKVDYFFRKYDVLHRRIVPHQTKVDEANIAELQTMTFVFLAMDAGSAKRAIVEHLAAWGIPFVDCGIGMHRQENSLRGTVRTTAGVPGRFDHLDSRISYTDVAANEYDMNIQTTDLNMLNATLAVIKWKKIFGYYVDSKQELNNLFNVAGARLVNGECAG
jgi:uncharacterized protein DUF6791/ThiF family protein